MRKTRLLKTCCTVIALLSGPMAGRADVVSEWNAIMVTTVSGQSPFAQARFAAITQLAVFEAVNAIKGDFKPYLGTINAPASASSEAAAIAAAHSVLKNYFPAEAASLDAARASSLASIADGPNKSAGIAAGDAAAGAMIAARANDGSGTAKFHMQSSSDPGEWQTTPSCPAGGGVFLHWSEVTPFGIKSASQFRLDPPPSLTSTNYTRDYNEVRASGGLHSAERPQDRTDVARVYAAVTPVLVFNPIVRIAAQGKSLTETARVYGGIHFRFEQEAGAEQGRRVGEYVFKNNFRMATACNCEEDN